MSVNKHILIGRLGNTPEARFTKSGKEVTNFSLATNEYFTKNGESQESTEWHRVVAFGKLAEICVKYLKKGRQVYVEGRSQKRKWEDRDGNPRETTEVIANIVRFLGDKNNQQSTEQASSDNSQSPSLDNTPPVIGDENVPF